ncbi:MAG: aminotransferase class III-fold pyridoxal phosphate-dependent enzyme, partial [Deltaproteobacteria bacterium]|nr:aminotransferase class III-fold pyridoxal phosphate-dependent enzyme [Deltaproteobacteria bacterium]
MTPPARPASPLTGDELPRVRTPLPGPRAQALVEDLAASECPGLTARRQRRAEAAGAPHDPIVWQAARGAVVRDVDGNVYLDMTAGFGAALIGHSHPHVLQALGTQAASLLHALGDVYPSAPKIALQQRLAALAPWPARVILGLSGSDAVEAALKTARLHTGRPGVLAFVGGYHGLSYGPLAACGYQEAFRRPFADQLNPPAQIVPSPRVLHPAPRAAARCARASLDAVGRVLAAGRTGAVLI